LSQKNPYQDQYRQNQVMTATPQQLVLMLYDRALRDLRLAKAACESEPKDIKVANESLLHLEEVLEELMLCLDMDLPLSEGGEIAQNLGRLYDYYIVRCREANITKDPAIVTELQKQIADLRETWAQAMRKAKAEPESL
jgi:flagellar protein FliS